MKPFHPLIAAFLLLCSVGLLRADSTNMQEVVPGRTLSLPTHGLVDLSAEGAVEFWYRHQGEHSAMKTFAQDKFVDDAYSIVMTLGVGADFKAAIVVGPGVDGTASIGVLNDVSALGNNEKTRKQIAKVSKADDFGKRDPIEFVKGSTYHILLAKRPGRDDIRVFVNGLLQGTLPATFGKAAATVSFGWDPKLYAPATKPADGDPAEPVVYPFNGFLGGLRFWNFGDFEETDAARLATFGRLIELADLTMLPEYGRLLAYGDFVGRRWNAQRMVMTTGADPVLRFADPLAGAWTTEGAVTHQTKTDTSVFDDYPVFTFLPATATLPQKIADRKYNVFEDGNFLGTISPVADNDRELWKLNCYHWSSRDGVVAEHMTVGAERFLKWTVSDMKRESKFAGITSGEVRMKRKSINDFGIKSPSAERMTPAEAKLRAQNDSLQLVFLYSAYPKFFDRMYQSYNIVKMDPWNLFEKGTGTDVRVIREPKAEQMFKLNLSEQMILPYDLEVMAGSLALDSSSTKLVSNASEYNAAMTSRIGAGVSGSVTVGTGGMVPVTAQGTVNLNIVVQYEAIQEMAGTSSESVEKLLRNKWEKKHTLLHRKEAMRISDEYAMALRTLHGQLAAAAPAARQQLVYDFFDKWGTHYPLAMIFGNLQLTETTVSDRMRTESNSSQSSLEVSVNEGKSGDTSVRKDGKTEQVRDTTTIVREFGDQQTQVPIALDLRPLTDLMTPQHFPEEPHIYTELRAVLATALPHYRDGVVASAVQGLQGPAAQNAKKVIAELQTPPPPPPPAEILAVRYLGISMDDKKLKAGFNEVNLPTPPQGIEMKLDGTIQFWPYLTASKDVPLPEHLHAVGIPFLQANPPVDVFAKTAPAEQVRRIKLGTSQGIQPFGDPKSTQMLVKVPGVLRDHAFVHVAGWFETVGPDHKAKGKSLSIGEMLFCELGRVEFPIGNGPLRFPFDMLVPMAPTVAGSVLWASDKPVQLPLRNDIMFNEHMTMKPGNKWLLKDRKDEAGEKYVFQYPSSIGGWRKGKAPVLMDFSGNGTLISTLWIHYEYALLKDFRDAVAQNKNVLPKDAWGTFSPGAKTPELNLFANRTGVRLSAAPSAPLPSALLDQLKVPPTLALKSHFLIAPGSTLMPRGFGVVEFIQQPAEPCWTFIERTAGEWMIINTLDARALTVAPDGSVVSATPRDGDTGQLWVPAAVANGYELRNKKTGGLLARATDPKNTRAMTVPAAQPTVSTVFSLSPKLDLTTEEGKTFDVILKSAGENKIPMIRVVREVTGLGLREAKDLVEGAPKVVKEALPKAEAEALKKKLEEQGGVVELILK